MVNNAHFFTVDLEDWYQGNEVIKLSEKSKFDDRIEGSTHKLLDLLDRNAVTATFFILAHCVEDKPSLVQEIVKRGHEIASHGYSHELVYLQQQNTFRQETERSKKVLEDLSGVSVKGYRASNWSIVSESLWALDILKELDFEYDSSIYPSKNYLYGITGAPIEPYRHRNGLLEIPPSVASLLNAKLPFAGGFYLRALPLWLIKLLGTSLENEGRKIVSYVHPWELDIDQPRNLELPALNYFIHYYNIRSVERKLDGLFSKFRFSAIRDGLDEIYASVPATLEL
jgi:polysaccharide deacetylase family protein (PEP-CTERM system associated)